MLEQRWSDRTTRFCEREGRRAMRWRLSYRAAGCEESRGRCKIRVRCDSRDIIKIGLARSAVVFAQGATVDLDQIIGLPVGGCERKE